MYHQICNRIGVGLLALSISTISQVAGKELTTLQSLRDLRHSPSPYECAILSAHAYQDNLQQGDPVLWKDPNSQQVHRIYGWTVAHVFTEDENDELLSKAFTQLGLPYGYKGVIYIHDQKKQCVLAHRGTDTKNMGALKTDVGSIAQNIIQGQERNMPRVLEQAIACAQEQNYSLTVTGHSLGGWLAQIAAFLAKVQYPEVHVKAITFDTPGARPMLEQINPRINPIPLDQIDITNYLSAPNLINACHPHVGTVYRIVFEAFQAKPALYTLQTHALSTLIQAFNPNTGDAYQCLQVNSWPVVSKKSLQLGKALVTGDKLQAVLALCQLLQRCIHQEALGEFSGFFKFAKRVNQYHPQGIDITSKDAFDLHYKYHYHTSPCASHKLHIRHFPAHAQSFLKKLEVGAKPHATLAERAQWLRAIQWNQQTGWVTILAEADLRIYCDQLISIVLDHPEISQTANLQIRAINHLLPPPSVSFFVGRKEKQRRLQQSLQANQDLILAPPITGPGGIGKTQLALRILHQQAERYDHVFWIPAESEEKLLDAYLRIAKGLGIYVDKQDPKQVVNAVKSYLQKKNCIYVFDDAPDIKAIEGYLPLTQGHVLITSRNSSPAAWWPVQPLALEPLSEQSAWELATQFGYGQSQEEQEALQFLLKRLPRYPLTLVHLFSTLEDEGYSPATFLTAMEEYAATAREQVLITLLNERPHGRVGYGQSMVYVSKTSLERLTKEHHGEKALQLISQLAYLDPKGIPLDWLLTWDTADTSPLKRNTRQALALLEQYSLVQWDKAKQQVYIHAETQLMVRNLYPQPTLEHLVNRLLDYVGDEAVAYKNATKWSSLLPHGRMLFEQLDTEKYLTSAYRLTQYLAMACRESCLFQESISWTKKGLQLAKQLYPEQNHPDFAQALNSIGASLAVFGKHQEAINYKLKALEMRKRLFKDQDHPDVARSLNEVVSSLSHLGNYQEALQYQQKTLAMRKRLLKDQDHHDLAHALNSVGELLAHLGKHQEALPYKQEALEMRKRLFKNRDHTDVARSLNSVGTSLEELGNYQVALQYKQEALAVRKRLYQNHDHRDVAHSLNNLGDILIKVGQPEQGVVYCKQALALRKRIYQDQDHHYVAYSLNSVGVGLTQLDEAEQGLVYSKQALAMLKRLFPDRDHPYMLPALNNIGMSLIRLNQAEAGMVYQQEALAMIKRLYPNQDHPWMAEILHSMGETLEGLEQLTEAVAHYNQALCMALRVYKNEHLHITQYLNHLIIALNKIENQTLIQQTKAEVLPLCNQWLGADHILVQQLRQAGN